MYNARMKNLRKRMAATGTDLVVMGPSSHLVWFSGLSPHGDERPVMLVVSQKSAGILMPQVNAASQRPLTKLPFFSWSDNEEDSARRALEALVLEVAPRRHGIKVALDETMRTDFALLVMETLPGGLFDTLHATVGLLRTVKDENEYKILKANALLNDAAMREGFACLTQGITEKQVARVISDFFVTNGAEAEFVDVAFGKNTAFPHHVPSDRTLEVNDTILLDIGGRRNGYVSDMTRVGVIGRPPQRYADVWLTVDRAVVAALKTAAAGREAKHIDSAAREAIESAGYGQYFPHRTGHGLGIDVHERPFISTNSAHILEDGNVFSIEPGVYMDGLFGVRLEEIVILRNGEPEILSEMSRDVVRL